MSDTDIKELREAALRVVEGRSDGLDRTFMSDILKLIEQRNELVEALRQIKRDTMHARRFGADTLQSYRGACSSAEGTAEDALNGVAAIAKAPEEHHE